MGLPVSGKLPSPLAARFMTSWTVPCLSRCRYLWIAMANWCGSTGGNCTKGAYATFFRLPKSMNSASLDFSIYQESLGEQSLEDQEALLHQIGTPLAWEKLPYIIDLAFNALLGPLETATTCRSAGQLEYPLHRQQRQSTAANEHARANERSFTTKSFLQSRRLTCRQKNGNREGRRVVPKSLGGARLPARRPARPRRCEGQSVYPVRAKKGWRGLSWRSTGLCSGS